MSTSDAHLHDLAGIGFGPSNLALAIALRELEHPVDPLTEGGVDISPPRFPYSR